MKDAVERLRSDLSRLRNFELYGRVTAIQGMLVELCGIEGHLSIGDRCTLEGRGGRLVPCEVVGFRDSRALAMPYGPLEGIGLGCKAALQHSEPVIYPTDDWLGRVINAFGDPVDGGPALVKGDIAVPIRNSPPPAHARRRLGPKIDLGVRALNAFTTVCRGQRLGVFSGSGVGKSILMSMMARFTEADVIVIGLVGERGREVQDFLADDLGTEGLKRAVVVVATSDESALMRREAAYMTLSVAEHFRDQGRNVLCLMDSVTRFAMAQREIGLSAGEPPASKGYTPTVFAELPRLLERAGPGTEEGSITGIFTVLVEGDDHNEPIADACRGILDGHIVLDRAIAHRNRYPAVDVLKSISRSMPDCNSDNENRIVDTARGLLASYENMAELIRLGAYRQGADPEVDRAIAYYPQIEAFLTQDKNERADLAHGYLRLAEILGMEVAAEDQAAAAEGAA